MVNAFRYGLASFFRMSKPIFFFFLSSLVALLVIELSQFVIGLQQSLQNSQAMMTSSGDEMPVAAPFTGLTTFAAQGSVMNALVLFFLSIPVAGQFAQEYRFNTLANTFLIAPKRPAVFLSKAGFALGYVTVAIAVMWLAIDLFGSKLPVPVTNGSEAFSPLYVTSSNITWSMNFDSSWWRVLLYVCGYMSIVISISIITKSQTLGALLPFFYLGLVESAAAISDTLLTVGAISKDWIPEQLRFFVHGQAWVNSDSAFANSGYIYFGGCLFLLALGFLLFTKRDTKV